MFNEADSEFFQDLVPWCSDPAKEEPVAIDPFNKREEISHITDTLHTTFSPQSWDVLDANSPAQAGYYTATPNGPLSPNMDGITTLDSKFLYNSDVENTNLHLLEPKLDIANLPVVLDLASEEMVDLNPRLTVQPAEFHNNTIQNTEYTSTIDTQKMFLHNVEEDDSLDMKLGSALLGDVENDNLRVAAKGRPGFRQRLSLNVTTTPASWSGGVSISTPEVLSYVEQLENEECSITNVSHPVEAWPVTDSGLITLDHCPNTMMAPQEDSPISESHVDSDVDDTKSRSPRKKRHNSEDSDESYTPYNEQPTRKYKRRKTNIPIKDMIIALEESQQLPKARRGRPPKRRESNVSSVCSVDDSASYASTPGDKYREQRDKNNEASKRSRMNRKLKELQMEQLAIELEERNKKLKIKADILEDMTKRLKDALMTAILQK